MKTPEICRFFVEREIEENQNDENVAGEENEANRMILHSQ